MPHFSRRSFCSRALALPLAAVAGRTLAAAQPRGLQIVVPTPSGTQPDLIARWLAEPMAQQLGVPAVVMNRPGASGAIAADAVLGAAPETGTVLLGGLDHVAYSHVGNSRRALDPFVDFVPAGVVNRDSWMVVCGPSAPFDGPRALAAASRRDGALTYATPGDGTTAHLLSANFCNVVGIDATAVPYKGPWQPDVISGRVHFAITPTPSVIGPLAGGQLRALASLTHARLPQLPQVPSIAELGWPSLPFSGGLFLFAPRALAPWAPKLNAALRDAVARPEVAAKYREAGIETAPLDLDRTRAAVSERLATVDTMRMAVFGRAR